MTNFGASITCGYYATQSNSSGYVYSDRGYAGRFDASLRNTTAQNLCRPGDMAADTVRSWIMPNASPVLGQNQLYTLLVGTNDARNCGTTSGCLTNYVHAMTAAVTWLAMPQSDKILGSTLANTSGWTPDLDIGAATTTAGASLSFPVTQVVDGRTLYIAYRVFAPGTITGGTATVQIDGKTVTTLASVPATGRSVATPRQLTDTIWAVGIPLGAAGAHTVTITNGSKGGFFSFQWAGVSTGSYASTPGAPRLMMSLLPPTSSQALTQTEVDYNNALLQLGQSIINDGMWLTVVHAEAVLDASIDLADEIHPNDTGHAKIFTAFQNAL